RLINLKNLVGMHVLHGLAKAAGPANLDLLDSLFAQAKVNALVTGRSLLSAHRCSKDRPGQASKENVLSPESPSRQRIVRRGITARQYPCPRRWCRCGLLRELEALPSLHWATEPRPYPPSWLRPGRSAGVGRSCKHSCRR